MMRSNKYMSLNLKKYKHLFINMKYKGYIIKRVIK
jgi:hypothetical protein